MDNELQDALKVIGFDKLYERYIPQLHPPNAKGERIALSPFPFTSNDTNPSFSVNVNNGLWQDWHAGISGNFVQFVAYLTAEWNEESGKPEPDFNEAERQLKVEFGVSKELDKIWLAKVQANLTVTSTYHKQWKQTKPWNEYILAGLGIGFDTIKQRFVFPIFNRIGTPITCRLYKPKVDNITPKTIWLNDNLADSYLFPSAAWGEKWNILVEGEPDAISLRSIGLPGCSGTLGAGSPVPSGLWWKDRDIYLCFDNDAAGERATKLAIDIMKNDAKSLRLVSLPKQFKDISDWLFSLSLSGLTVEAIQQEVTQLLVDAKSVQVLHQIYDAPATPLPYEDALSSLNIAKKISFLATVIARSSQTFSLATNITATCPASGHKYCGKCNMRNKFKGNARIIIDPRSAIALKLINAAEKDIFLAIKESQDIIIQCEDCNMQVVSSTDVESILVSPSQSELSDRHINPSDNKRNEALILSNRMVDVESNQDYTLEGLVYAHPKNQKLTFVIDRAIRHKTDLETFAINDDVYNTLKQFQPVNETPIQTIIRQCTDMADSFTMIKNRLDLHVAYSTVWHSTIRFPFLGQVYERGWIDALVVGDTRTGKSSTFQRMAKVLGTGTLIDCKLLTTAGILGAVETSSVTGERYIVAGLLPQNDMRGPILMDEFVAGRWDRVGILDHLSSTRAEGVVRISKAASAIFNARVRLIWSANPGRGRLLRDIGTYGCEVIPKIINQPEDIARFDFALAVAQHDVSAEEINSMIVPTQPIYDSNSRRLLLLWAWTRKADQIIWANGAEEAVINYSKFMYTKYDSSIPLVEASDQRHRIAKVAISIAMQCFSTEDGVSLIVKPEHVHAAVSFMCSWFDNQSMGYDRFSHDAARNREVIEPGYIINMMMEIYNIQAVPLAKQLLKTSEFSERTFSILVPSDGIVSQRFMSQLISHNCVQPASGLYKDTWEITSRFGELLRNFVKVHKTGDK